MKTNSGEGRDFPRRWLIVGLAVISLVAATHANAEPIFKITGRDGFPIPDFDEDFSFRIQNIGVPGNQWELNNIPLPAFGVSGLLTETIRIDYSDPINQGPINPGDTGFALIDTEDDDVFLEFTAPEGEFAFQILNPGRLTNTTVDPDEPSGLAKVFVELLDNTIPDLDLSPFERVGTLTINFSDVDLSGPDGAIVGLNGDATIMLSAQPVAQPEPSSIASWAVVVLVTASAVKFRQKTPSR